MTQEDKELLVKDLCARLPYGVQCEIGGLRYGPYTFTGDDVEDLIDGRTFKPYLRPMSSMTVAEEYEYHQYKNIDYLEISEMEHKEMLKATALYFSRATDWLNKKGFDYRGLIPMGLALEAPEGMYN